MKRWVAFLPLIVLIGFGALFAVYALNHDPQYQPTAMVGKPLPDIELTSLDDGLPVKLRELASEGPMVVNFFASWCAPCAVEAPTLMSMKSQGARIVGINYEDTPPRGSPEAARAFLSRLGDPFAVRLADPKGRAGVEFGITGVPETYLVSRDGKILKKFVGPLNEKDAAALVAATRGTQQRPS